MSTTRQRLFAVFLTSAVLVLGLGACGGSDDEDTTSAGSTPATQAETAPQGDVETRGAEENAKSGGKSSANENATGADNEGESKRSAEVDLSVDPSRIRGAVVTETGAVQTLEPEPENHETAQENSYSSIKAFGEEAEGEEATNITFALVQYLDAKASGDWATACARLYSVLRESLEKQSQSGSCIDLFGALMSRSSPANRQEEAKIDVSSVRRDDGNRAFVIYKTPQTLSADMPMYVEDGIWKVAALQAYALTPEQLE